jgi:hypothetical protein
VINVKCVFKFKNRDGDRRFVSLAEGVEDAIERVKKEINFDDTSSRPDELKKLCYSLQDLRNRGILNNNSKMLISLSQISRFNNAGNDKGDLDGFCLSFTDGDFGVLLVEAKRGGKKKYREAKEQLTSELIN